MELILSKSFYTKLQLAFASLVCQSGKVLYSLYIQKWKVKSEWGRQDHLSMSVFEVEHYECFALLLKYGRTGKQAIIVIAVTLPEFTLKWMPLYKKITPAVFCSQWLTLQSAFKNRVWR